jgi:hypothetical protein
MLNRIEPVGYKSNHVKYKEEGVDGEDEEEEEKRKKKKPNNK